VLVGIAHNKINNSHVLPIQAWHKSVRNVVSPNAVIQAQRDVGTVNIEGKLAVVIGRATAGITVDTELDDPEHVAITVSVNGTVKADSGTFNLPSTVAESIAYVARWVPLGPGDVIMSGSPNKFVSVTPGDIVEIRLSRVGSLTNHVV
jgi:2-keto-4-pentenoate hydratase/2-oxohepta-3-ene-1,7-dioic acid hydratase in catechol pathway